jgi:hypothetical protein
VQMASGLTIKVVDPDNDYLGIEIRASNDRFAGIALVYAGLEELSEFAARIAGFPSNANDERKYDFGSREPSTAGGYCSLRFHGVNPSGYAIVEIDLEDDDKPHANGAAHLSFRVEPAAIDRFTTALRGIETRFGEAILPASD